MAKVPQPNARAPKISRSSADDEQLTRYLDAIGKTPVLAPDKERELAIAIEDAERNVWRLLLATPSDVCRIAELVEQRLETPALAKLQPVVRAASACLEQDSPGRQQHLGVVSEQAAIELRALDSDHAIIKAVLEVVTNTRAVTARRQALRLRDQFLTANLRIVVNMARRYDRGVMSLDDLIQEGNLGLMHALSRFDHRRNIKFSTYAAWWIRHAINRSMADKGKTVRVPVHALEAQMHLERKRQELTGELGRPPTIAELAKAMKTTVDKVTEAQTLLMGMAVSFEQPVYSDDRANKYHKTVADTLVDDAGDPPDPFDGLELESMVDQVQRLMAKLTPLESDVLTMRFGLDDGDEQTFKAIGAKHGVSKEHVRKVMAVAVEKLAALVKAERSNN